MMNIEITHTLTDEERAFVNDKIKAHNNQISPYHRAARQPGAIQPLGVFLRNEQGQIIGALVGDTYWSCFHIDDFWVDESLRGEGYGSQLLQAAEAEAQKRGCHFAHLSTFSFQAYRFYEKHGWRVVGELTDYPPGASFYWMRKDFV